MINQWIFQPFLKEHIEDVNVSKRKVSLTKTLTGIYSEF